MVSSNDVTITERDDGALAVRSPGNGGSIIYPVEVFALRAHFAAEQKGDYHEGLEEGIKIGRAEWMQEEEWEAAYPGDVRPGYDVIKALVDAAASALEAAQRPPVSPDYEERYHAAVTEVQKLFRDAPTPGEVVRALERIGWAPTPVPPVNPEQREALAATMREHYVGPDATPDGHGVCVCGGWVGDDMNPEDWDDHLTDAILAQFSVPSQPVYDEEAIARWLAYVASDWTHNDCGDDDHPFGHTNWQAWLDDAAAFVAALRGGELTREETTL